MQPEKEIMIKHSLEKAQQALESAKLNFDNNLLTDSQNRIYYAIFYTVLALGYLDGFITGSHSELMGWFNRKYIYEQKLFDKNIAETYKTAYRDRKLFDYTVYKSPEKDKLDKDLQDASLFVDTLSKHILDRIN